MTRSAKLKCVAHDTPRHGGRQSHKSHWRGTFLHRASGAPVRGVQFMMQALAPVRRWSYAWRGVCSRARLRAGRRQPLPALADLLGALFGIRVIDSPKKVKVRKESLHRGRCLPAGSPQAWGARLRLKRSGRSSSVAARSLLGY